jgi:hypothetical protein
MQLVLSLFHFPVTARRRMTAELGHPESTYIALYNVIGSTALIGCRNHSTIATLVSMEDV